ncbi:Uncharacterised protein [Mycobacterium tuberculosis]|nr:Uncharacterised protein [Mycobacterium tuberculosis]
MRKGVMMPTLISAPIARRSRPGIWNPTKPTVSCCGGRGSGVMSNRISPSPAPETPSTMA